MVATEFIVEFIVQEGNVNQYETFISDLRQRLSAADTFTHGILALLAHPPPSPPRFFDLVLRTNDHSVTLRFRMDNLGYRMKNLYLIGYRMENGQLEFDNSAHMHLITEAGTEFLDFDDSYTQLGRAADMSRDDITIGSQTLANAIHKLATSEDGGARTQSLMTVIVMFLDAIRLIDVQDFVARSYVLGARIQDADSCLDLKQQIHAWGRLPKGIFPKDAFPWGWPVFRRWGIRRIVEMMHLDKHYCFKEPPCMVKGLPTLQPNEDGGLPLLAVFSVQIFNSNVYVGSQVYGIITVTDALRTQDIYNRSRDNPDYISAGPYDVLLTGPSEAISALGHFIIKFCLYDKARKDEVIIDEDIVWNFYDFGNVYDKLISKQLSIGTGSLTINYAVFGNAVTAKLKLQKLQGGESESKVYGKVSGSTSCDGKTKTLLFHRERADYVTIRYGDIIPLSRSVVFVSLSCSTFKVTVKLFDSNVFSDQEVVDTTITFQPKISGSDVKPIREECFEGSMSVDWVVAF